MHICLRLLVQWHNRLHILYAGNKMHYIIHCFTGIMTGGCLCHYNGGRCVARLNVLGKPYDTLWCTSVHCCSLGNPRKLFNLFWLICYYTSVVVMYCHGVAWLLMFMANSSYGSLSITGQRSIMVAQALTKHIIPLVTMVARALACQVISKWPGG